MDARSERLANTDLTMLGLIDLQAWALDAQRALTDAANISQQVPEGGEVGTPAAHWRVEGKPDPHGTRYDCERASLAGGDMTDCEVANAVYLDPSIVNLTIAKDRIRWLSRKLATSPQAPQVIVGDDALPGMWSHSDFTGGDPDERSHADRKIAASQPQQGAVFCEGCMRAATGLCASCAESFRFTTTTGQQAVDEAARTTLEGVAESLCELEVCARNASRATGIGGIDGEDLDGLRKAFGRLADSLEVQQDVIRQHLTDDAGKGGGR